MSKKKKRNPTLNSENLETKVLQQLQNNPKTRFHLKELAKRLHVSNSLDEIREAADKLVSQTAILKVAKGKKYKYNKDFKGHSNKNGKSNSRKSKKGKNYATGKVDTTRSGAAYIVSEDSGLDRDIFVPQSRLANALKGDIVKVRWFIRRGKPEGEVIDIKKRQRESFIGTFVTSKKFSFVAPDGDYIPVDILVEGKNDLGAKSGDKVVVRITEWHSKHGISNPKGTITMVLGRPGTSDIEMKAILIKQGFDLSFPDEVLRENAAIPVEIPESEIENRRDMREITTFTIDPETAKDFDDALSVELLENGNYEIGIHIADVTYYVEEGSELDKEAANRTTSVYLVDRVLPMLPEKLSNGVCSLRPHEDKLTFSAIFELTPKGEIVNEWFGKTIIHSDRRYAYEEVQEILDGAEGDYADELKLLNKYAHTLRKARFKKGAISFESPEVRFKLDEDGTPIEAYVKERKDAHMLVEDFMLLANRRVAAKIMNQFREGGPKVPFVYRVHDEPDMEKVQNFTNFAAQMGYPLNIKSTKGVAKAYNKMLKDSAGKHDQAVLQQLAIRTMSKAAYTTENIGHYGLGFEDYTHFTSPIRRYADVLVHRIFHKFLNEEPIKITQPKLEDICKHISSKERNAMDAERESIKYKQAEYLQDHVGEVFEAAISGMTDFGVYAEIKANFCEGMIRYENMYDNFVLSDDGFHIRSQHDSYKMGDTIYIRVVKVDLNKRQVDMHLIHEADALAEMGEENYEEIVEEEDTTPKEETPISNEIVKIPKAINDLMMKIAVAFGASDVRKVAQEEGREWNYALTATQIQKQSLVFLGFNWKTELDTDYPPQTVLPTDTLDKQKWSMAIPFLEKHFDEYLVDTIVETVYCPFRSQEEGQVTKEDLEACQAIFKNWLKQLQPHKMISFSVRLRDYLKHQGLLNNLEERKFQVGKRKITVVKATIKAGRKSYPIVFFPSLKTRINKGAKDKMWAWAAS